MDMAMLAENFPGGDSLVFDFVEVVPSKMSSYDNDKVWYSSLDESRKREMFGRALDKFPWLGYMMKLHGVKARDEEFLEHFTFRLMMDILRGDR